MQSKTTLRRMTKGFLRNLVLAGFCSFAVLGSQAQVYVNGNLSTGATTQSGTAAPAGYTWSEVQNPTGNTSESNTIGGLAASVSSGNTIADDFIVPAGPSWTVTKLTFYSYQTGAPATPSPFTTLRFQIHNSNPSAGPTTIVFGDLTTNRMTATNDALMYRVFNTVAPPPGTAAGTTRKIWTLEADVNITLAPGTYWIEWQTNNTGGTAHFAPPSTVPGVRTVAGYNAIQRNTTTNVWTAISDDGNPASAPDVALDMPFRINYTTSSCTGTPDPGTTLSTAASVCPGTPFILSFSNNVSGAGISFQWQSSPDGVTWTNIAGATNPTYTTTQTASTYYRCSVNCNTGGTGNSTALQVLLTPPSNCYCTSAANSTQDEDIFNVTIGSLNNTSDCNTLAPGFGSLQNRYSNYTSGTGAPAPGRVVSGGNNPFSVTVGTCGGNFGHSVAIWIDFDQNGNFAPSERVYNSPTVAVGLNTRTGNAFIPSTALPGQTLMRVVCVETGNSANIQPCGTYEWGETEDYFVNIVPCTPVSVGTQPSNQTASCGGSATFSTVLNGDNPSYQWQAKAPSSNFWIDLTNGGQYSGVRTSTLNISSITDVLNGYQYRVVFTGGCSATDFTAAATLTVNRLAANVTPTSAAFCQGGSQMFQINNSASASTTNNYASGAVNIAIPDNQATGISSTINVNNIPANAVITAIDVKFNATHTWVGDLDINLVAPNNQSLNLIGRLNGGAGNNGTSDFVNTVISSASTNLISGAPAPRTGTFAAERRPGNGTSGNPQVGNLNWSDLYGTANGDWKLVIADKAGLDDGTLQNWDITITYTSPTLATGVWTPTAGLFTDAGLTTPYTGGPINTVYAAPTATTTYSVIVTTDLCTTDPLALPVTVGLPISNVSEPADEEVCAGATAAFVVGADGGPIAYQWQVSTDGGATWTNVADGGVYSGATTATLGLANVPGSFNGNRYRCVLDAALCASNVTSTDATLTVNVPPAVSISAAPFSSLYPGTRTVLTANTTPSTPNATYQWYLNGTAIPGATGSSLEVNIDGLGDYSVDAFTQSGCPGNTSASFTVRDSLNTSLFIYPNPNNGQFQVRYHDRSRGLNSPMLMNIYDSKGARVRNSRYLVNTAFGRMDVDLTMLPKGVYFIEMVDAGGVRLKSGRVVVQ